MRATFIVLPWSADQLIRVFSNFSRMNGADFKGLKTLAEFSGSRFENGVLFYSGQEILPFKMNERIFYALPIGMLIKGKEGI
jgi:hypothetical protein